MKNTLCRAVVNGGLLALLASACGGSSSSSSGSGVDGTKYLDQLSASEKTTMCTWLIAKEGGAGEKTCGGSVKVTVPTQSACEMQTQPHCLVSVAESCVNDVGGDACKILSDTSPASCKTFIACSLGGP